MFINKPISYANTSPYKTSGVLIEYDNNELVMGMKQVKVISERNVRCNIRDITSTKSFNIDYEIFDNIIEVQMDDASFEDNYNHFIFKDCVYEFLDRLQNFQKRTTTIRYGFKGIMTKDINYVK